MNPNTQSKLGFLFVLGLFAFGAYQCQSYIKVHQAYEYEQKIKATKLYCVQIGSNIRRDEKDNPKDKEKLEKNHKRLWEICNYSIEEYLGLTSCEFFLEEFNRNNGDILLEKYCNPLKINKPKL